MGSVAEKDREKEVKKEFENEKRLQSMYHTVKAIVGFFSARKFGVLEIHFMHCIRTGRFFLDQLSVFIKDALCCRMEKLRVVFKVVQ